MKSEERGFILTLTSDESSTLITALKTDIKNWKGLLSKDISPKAWEIGMKYLNASMLLLDRVQNLEWTVQ